MPIANLFDTTDEPQSGERFDCLLQHRNLMIERIVSASHITPTLYVQDQDEWVVLLKGEATLIINGKPMKLQTGDHAFLPAGTPHQVEGASQGAIWLAVHLRPEATNRQVPAHPNDQEPPCPPPRTT